MIDLKFYEAEGGFCENCGRQMQSLILTVIKNGNAEKQSKFCRDCAISVRNQVEKRNEAESASRPAAKPVNNNYGAQINNSFKAPVSAAPSQSYRPQAPDNTANSFGSPYGASNTPNQPDTSLDSEYGYLACASSPAKPQRSAWGNRDEMKVNIGAVFALITSIYFGFAFISSLFRLGDSTAMAVVYGMYAFLSAIPFGVISIIGLTKDTSKTSGFIFSLAGGIQLLYSLIALLSTFKLISHYDMNGYVWESPNITIFLSSFALILEGVIILITDPKKPSSSALFVIPGVAYAVLDFFGNLLAYGFFSGLFSSLFRLPIPLCLIFYLYWYFNPYIAFDASNTAPLKGSFGYNQNPSPYVQPSASYQNNQPGDSNYTF